MTPNQHPGGDDAASLYQMADAMHKRALAQTHDAITHADAGEWDAAVSAMDSARRSEVTAIELAIEAEQV